MKETIYKFGKYFLILFVAAPALALLLYATIGGSSVWVIVCLMIGLAVLDIIYGPMKKVRQAIGYTFYIVLGVALIYTTAGNWMIKKFNQNFPLMAQTMPRTIFGLDLLGTAKKYQPMVEAKATLLLYQQEQEKELAPVVLKKVKEGRWDEARDLITRWDKNWEDSKKVIMPSGETTPARFFQATAIQTVYNIPGKTLTITLQPEEVYTVDELKEGQNWRYLSFNGAFSHRIDKGDGKACWKVVDNNLPWSAGWNGTLEVKAGNTPATLTVNIL